MRRVLVLALAIAAVSAGGAHANGSSYSPGLVYGWSGVGAQGSGVRFVAFGMPKSTIVAAVRPRDGHVLQSKVVQGFYGVPLVTYDGTSGGLSGDGTSLALASYGPYPGQAGKTRFVLLSTRTLGVLRQVVLPGSWSYDACQSIETSKLGTRFRPTARCSISSSTSRPARSRATACVPTI